MSLAAGIIAAGDGTRLAAARPGTPKPLVQVAGRPLAHWVLDGLVAAGADRVLVWTNTRGTELAGSLRSAFPMISIYHEARDTASSFETFRLVSARLAFDADDFLVSTTDALIRPDEVARFLAECRASRAEAGLALTKHVDDEKPLWTSFDGKFVSSVGGESGNAVTCGLYYMTKAAAAKMPEAGAHSRLRDFLSSLVSGGTRVAGVLLSKSLDVDRPEDLAAAESFLTTELKCSKP